MRRTALALGLAALLLPAKGFADDAKHREGGSASSRSAGERHHATPATRSSTPSVSRAPSASEAPARSGSATLTPAQARHPRAGTGHGWRTGGYYGWSYPHYRSYPYYRGYYYRPSYWGYSYYPFGGLYFESYWGYPYGYYGGSYYGGGSYYARRYDNSGSMRILVDPERTRVYVDGYYAGIADDFDGLFQRLRVAPGRHEIMLKLDGYRTARFRVYVPYDGTIKLHHDMARGAGEDETEQVLGDPRDGERYDQDDRDRWSDRDERYERDDRDDDEPAEAREPRREAPADARALRLDVTPDDASVYVDGEFRGSGRDARLLQLASGRHRLEVVRPGYRPYERDIDVSADETTSLVVRLER